MFHNGQPRMQPLQSLADLLRFSTIDSSSAVDTALFEWGVVKGDARNAGRYATGMPHVELRLVFFWWRAPSFHAGSVGSQQSTYRKSGNSPSDTPTVGPAPPFLLSHRPSSSTSKAIIGPKRSDAERGEVAQTASRGHPGAGTRTCPPVVKREGLHQVQQTQQLGTSRDVIR